MAYLVPGSIFYIEPQWNKFISNEGNYLCLMHKSLVHIYKEDRRVVVVGVVHRITILVDASLLYMGWMRPQRSHLAGAVAQWRAASTRKWKGMREVCNPARSCCVILMVVLGTSKGAKVDLQGFLAPADFLKLFQMQPLPTEVGSLGTFKRGTWWYSVWAWYSLSQAVKVLYSCHVWSDELLQTPEIQIIHLV